MVGVAVAIAEDQADMGVGDDDASPPPIHSARLAAQAPVPNPAPRLAPSEQWTNPAYIAGLS